jgi:multidrug efflux pump
MEHLSEKLKEFAITKWCVENKTTIYIFTFLISVLGISVFQTMPREQFPEIAVPTIIVSTIYPGASPTDVENAITKPLEKQLKSAKGVSKIKSNSIQDFSLITIEFDTDVNAKDAKQRVKDEVDRAKKDLPTDLTQDPAVAEVNFSEFPIRNINLSGNYPLVRLKQYAEQLKDEIEGMPEITRVDIVGALDREIQINLNLYKMTSSGVSFYEIENTIKGENINISGGELNVDDIRRTLRVAGEFRNIEQIANLQIRSSTGATVRLGDIAEVKDAFVEKQNFARLDGKTVITLNVIKRGGTNLISAADGTDEIIKKYQETKFPEGLKVSVTADQSVRTKVELNDLINTVILGFIFVVIVLMFFMGVTDAIFIGLSVPLSALLAMIFFPSMDFTLNTIVLFGFLLGLGIVVDDAIVVIENAHRIFNQDKKISLNKAIASAAGEVFVPVLTGTLTTIAPFLPLLFWPGIVGEFMKFLPLTLIFTLFASLFVAYIINPVFASSFMKRHDENEYANRSPKSMIKPLIVLLVLTIIGYIINFGLGNLFAFFIILYVFNYFILTPLIHRFQEKTLPRFKNAYKRLIAYVIHGYRPYIFTFATLVLFIGTIIAVQIVKPKSVFFPSGEPDFTYIYNVVPIGTDARKTDSLTKLIEAKVYQAIGKDTAAVASVITNVGLNAGDPFNPDRTATPHKSKITVAYKSGEERIKAGLSSQTILDRIRKNVNGIPGADIIVEPERNGPPTGKAVTIEIKGENFEQLIKLEKIARAAIDKANVKGIEKLKSDLVLNKPEIIVQINREKASREGISTVQIAMQIRTALFGKEVSKLRDAKDDYPIMVRLEKNDRNQIEKLLAMQVVYRDMNLGGVLRQVPLSSVADIKYSTTYSGINRKNQERVVTLSSDILNGFNANDVNLELKQVFDNLEVPAGYSVSLSGEQEEQMKSMKFLGNAFLIALFLIFLILVTQFNSVSKPIIIFITIVFSLIGVLWGFMLTGMTMSIIMTGVGVIALAGIVVKNGILLIEFTDELRGRGYELYEAVIEAGAIRLTPVLLTASACILGLIPLGLGMNINFVSLFTHFDPEFFIGGFSAVFWGSLAWTIVFGLSFSTFLTLVMVPAMYIINEKLQSFIGKFFKKEEIEADLSESE